MYGFLEQVGLNISFLVSHRFFYVFKSRTYDWFYSYVDEIHRHVDYTDPYLSECSINFQYLDKRNAFILRISFWSWGPAFIFQSPHKFFQDYMIQEQAFLDSFVQLLSNQYSYICLSSNLTYWIYFFSDWLTDPIDLATCDLLGQANPFLLLYDNPYKILF